MRPAAADVRGPSILTNKRNPSVFGLPTSITAVLRHSPELWWRAVVDLLPGPAARRSTDRLSSAENKSPGSNPACPRLRCFLARTLPLPQDPVPTGAG